MRRKLYRWIDQSQEALAICVILAAVGGAVYGIVVWSGKHENAIYANYSYGDAKKEAVNALLVNYGLAKSAQFKLVKNVRLHLLGGPQERKLIYRAPHRYICVLMTSDVTQVVDPCHVNKRSAH